MEDGLVGLKDLKSAADFCLECGSLVNLSDISEFIECSRCGFRCSIIDFPTEVIVTKKEYTEKKVWLEEYYKRQRNDGMEEEEEEVKENRNKTQMKCPNPVGCDSNEMYYKEVQLRSADEGSTLIYTCVKCDHSMQINN